MNGIVEKRILQKKEVENNKDWDVFLWVEWNRRKFAKGVGWGEHGKGGPLQKRDSRERETGVNATTLHTQTSHCKESETVQITQEKRLNPKESWFVDLPCFFRDRNFVSDRSSLGSLSSANAAGRIQQLHLSEDLSPREIQENIFSLQAGIHAMWPWLILWCYAICYVVLRLSVLKWGR